VGAWRDSLDSTTISYGESELAGELRVCLTTSMWIELAEITELHEVYLAAIGRALAVAQHFEQTCRYVLTVAAIGAAHEGGSIDSLDDAKGLVEYLGRCMLGQLVVRFDRLGEVSYEHLTILDNGRAARNYVAHEAASIVSECPESEDRIQARTVTLEGEVHNLVEADALVSEWSYFIQEQASLPEQHRIGYRPALTSWILAPIAGRLPKH